MVFQIEKDHFELNFQGQEAGFQLDGGYYKKTVSEDDLIVAFDDDNMVSEDKRSLYCDLRRHKNINLFNRHFHYGFNVERAF